MRKMNPLAGAWEDSFVPLFFEGNLFLTFNIPNMGNEYHSKVKIPPDKLMSSKCKDLYITIVGPWSLVVFMSHSCVFVSN